MTVVSVRKLFATAQLVHWHPPRRLLGPPPNDHTRSLEKIAAALAGQEKRRADYRKTLPAKPLRQGLLQWVKKSACESPHWP